MITLLLLALGIQITPYKDWQNEALYGSGESGTYEKKYEPPKYINKSLNRKKYVKSKKHNKLNWIIVAFEPKD